jgi:hypothetical protein
MRYGINLANNYRGADYQAACGGGTDMLFTPMEAELSGEKLEQTY